MKNLKVFALSAVLAHAFAILVSAETAASPELDDASEVQATLSAWGDAEATPEQWDEVELSLTKSGFETESCLSKWECLWRKNGVLFKLNKKNRTFRLAPAALAPASADTSDAPPFISLNEGPPSVAAPKKASVPVNVVLRPVVDSEGFRVIRIEQGDFRLDLPADATHFYYDLYSGLPVLVNKKTHLLEQALMSRGLIIGSDRAFP
jgi:hypothetical protein